MKNLGNPSAEKRCIIVGSNHYPHTDVDVKDIPQSVRDSQFQLFALLTLFKKYGVHSPLCVEGLSQSVKGIRSSIMVQLPNAGSMPIHSDEAQEFLLQHPDEFIALQEKRHQNKHNTAFFELSSYQNIVGAHSDAIHEDLEQIYPQQTIEYEFFKKYQPIKGMGEMYKKKKFWRWWIYVNGTPVRPKVMLKDCNDYLQFLDEIDAFNKKREEEVVSYCIRTRDTSVPMSWVGLRHLEPITKECLSRGMAVTQVIPSGNIGTSTQSPNRSVALQLKEFAESCA